MHAKKTTQLTINIVTINIATKITNQVYIMQLTFKLNNI